MKKKEKQKLFVVRKYIMAESAQAAIRKDKTTPVDDVWIDDEWKKKGAERLEDAIGFTVENNDKD